MRGKIIMENKMSLTFVFYCKCGKHIEETTKKKIKEIMCPFCGATTPIEKTALSSPKFKRKENVFYG
jgi:hypothetical protein